MFFSEKGTLQQLEICYLFLHADGQLSAQEKKHLNEIVSKKKLSESQKRDFQAFCGEVNLRLTDRTSKNVISEVEKVLGDKSSGWGTIDGSKSLQAETIWALINLGYADDEYSAEEKEIVDYLVGRWKMDPNLVTELNDTADTILALTLEKNWLLSSNKPQTEIDRIMKEINSGISSLFANVEITIAEADIV